MLLLRSVTCVLVVILLSFAGMRAAAAATPRPRSLGVYSAWTAATFRRGGHRICYVFAMPRKSRPAGRRRAAVLMVSKTRGSAPLVTFSARRRLAASAVSVGPRKFPLHVFNKGDAFARNSAALVAAFRRGRSAAVASRDAHRVALADTFSLSGFSAAYVAIQRQCPS